MPQIVPFNFGHLVEVADDVREIDRQELAAFLGRDPWRAIGFIADNATEIWTVLHDGRAAAVAGYNVTNVMENVASPFMIATNYAAERPRVFARASREAMTLFSGKYLLNYVSDSNSLAIKWLQWLGFYVAPPESYQGVMMVRRFTKDCR